MNLSKANVFSYFRPLSADVWGQGLQGSLNSFQVRSDLSSYCGTFAKKAVCMTAPLQNLVGLQPSHSLVGTARINSAAQDGKTIPAAEAFIGQASVLGGIVGAGFGFVVGAAKNIVFRGNDIDSFIEPIRQGFGVGEAVQYHLMMAPCLYAVPQILWTAALVTRVSAFGAAGAFGLAVDILDTTIKYSTYGIYAGSLQSFRLAETAVRLGKNGCSRVVKSGASVSRNALEYTSKAVNIGANIGLNSFYYLDLIVRSTTKESLNFFASNVLSPIRVCAPMLSLMFGCLGVVAQNPSLRYAETLSREISRSVKYDMMYMASFSFALVYLVDLYVAQTRHSNEIKELVRAHQVELKGLRNSVEEILSLSKSINSEQNDMIKISTLATPASNEQAVKTFAPLLLALTTIMTKRDFWTTMGLDYDQSAHICKLEEEAKQLVFKIDNLCEKEDMVEEMRDQLFICIKDIQKAKMDI